MYNDVGHFCDSFQDDHIQTVRKSSQDFLPVRHVLDLSVWFFFQEMRLPISVCLSEVASQNDTN